MDTKPTLYRSLLWIQTEVVKLSSQWYRQSVTVSMATKHLHAYSKVCLKVIASPENSTQRIPEILLKVDYGCVCVDY